MIGRTNVSGGGLEINGIIEQYKVASGGNISAGDFVSFINEMGTDTQLSSGSSSGASISAVALSSNKVFIAYNFYYNSSMKDLLYAIVCTISGTTITAGTETRLSSTSYTGNEISAVALSDSKVFIAHGYLSNNSLYAIVCTISDTTITKGTDTLLSSSTNSGHAASTITLSDSKVAIFHTDNNGSLKAIVCTISDTTITAGTDTQFIYQVNIDTISSVLISSNKIFVTHSRSENGYSYLYAIVCTISGTTITNGTDTQLSTVKYSGNKNSVVLLSENKVFIAHSYANDYTSPSSSIFTLRALVCTVSGTTITAGTDTLLNDKNYTGNEISAIALSSNKVFVFHTTSSSLLYLGCLICTVSGTTITVKSDSQINNDSYSGCKISPILLSNNKVFIAHNGGSSQLYSLISEYNITNNVTNIDGVAKDSETAGDTIDVYTPNYT